MIKNDPCRKNKDKLQGVLIDVNTSNIISCGELLDVKDINGHTVAKIDVSTATIESKKGCDFTRSMLNITNFFVMRRKKAITIVTRTDECEYVCDSYNIEDIVD